MALEHELGLKKPFAGTAHEAIVSIYYTGSCIRKKAERFLKPFGLTDVWLNLMMMLRHQGGKEGLSQAQLSRMLLVNRANITGLVDRMEKSGLVIRTKTSDRRFNIIRLTRRGSALLDKVEPVYAMEVAMVMSALDNTQQKKLTRMLEKVRQKLS